ncbi:2OG-Fe(II) oxygenase family protein [Sphingomonas oryzagri]
MASTPSFDTALAIARRDARDVAAVAPVALRAIDERREEDGLALIDQALHHAPRAQVLLHVQGLLYRALGETGRAVAALDEAAGAGPPTSRLAQARAHVALEAGFPAAALHEEARRMAPLDRAMVLGHAAALAAEGREADADALLVDTLRDDPRWIEGHAALARTRQAAGRSGKLASIDAALTAAPRELALWQLKIALQHRAREHDAEANTIAQARQQFGESEALVAAAAMLAAELGEAGAGDAAFARLDPFAETALMVHWLRHQVRQGRPERVVAQAPRLIARADVNDAWPYLSIAMRMTGDARIGWLEDVPRFVRVFDLGFSPGDLADLATCLRSLHLARAQPLDQSVRGGTQTDGPLFQRMEPPIRALRQRIEKAIAEYVAALPDPIEGHPLLGHIPRRPRFIGSWSVRLTGGGFHDPHIHSYGWLSSAFYVAVPEAAASGEEGFLTLGEPQAMLATGLAPYRTIAPRPGHLVLFPSTMWHATRPFGSGERLTAAFDVG